jgi:hypothetical protein
VAVSVIQGFRGRDGGPALVLVDDAILALPDLLLREARHSPDGFQWGYSGSGPAELARALLIACCPGDPTVRDPRCYQRFKAEVIAQLSGDTFVLSGASVVAWVARWKGLASRPHQGIGSDRPISRSEVSPMERPRPDEPTPDEPGDDEPEPQVP